MHIHTSGGERERELCAAVSKAEQEREREIPRTLACANEYIGRWS